jgi:hypothetical protein
VLALCMCRQKGKTFRNVCGTAVRDFLRVEALEQLLGCEVLTISDNRMGDIYLESDMHLHANFDHRDFVGVMRDVVARLGPFEQLFFDYYYFPEVRNRPTDARGGLVRTGEHRLTTKTRAPPLPAVFVQVYMAK